MAVPASSAQTCWQVCERLGAEQRLDARECSLRLYTNEGAEIGPEDVVRPFSYVVAARLPAHLLGDLRVETFSANQSKMRA